MTEEQEKQVAEIRAVDYHETSGVGKLLAIIDDLQKQKPKRYTEAELREAFASQYQDGLHRDDRGKFTSMELEAYYFEWIDCARFLNALKD